MLELGRRERRKIAKQIRQYRRILFGSWRGQNRRSGRAGSGRKRKFVRDPVPNASRKNHAIRGYPPLTPINRYSPTQRPAPSTQQSAINTINVPRAFLHVRLQCSPVTNQGRWLTDNEAAHVTSSVRTLGRNATPGSTDFWHAVASWPAGGRPGQDRTAWSKQRCQALQLRRLVGHLQRY